MSLKAAIELNRLHAERSRGNLHVMLWQTRRERTVTILGNGWIWDFEKSRVIGTLIPVDEEAVRNAPGIADHSR